MRPSPALSGVMLCAVLTACQSGPTAPERVPPSQDPTGSLPAGRYFLSVGVALESEAPCTGPMNAWGPFGPNIAAFVVLAPQADAWVGRLESPSDGTLELQLRESGGNAAAVTGTLHGHMTHLFDRFFSSPPRGVTFAGRDSSGAATLDGVRYAAAGVVGTATGEVTFTHTSGNTIACTEVTLILGSQ